MCVSGIYPVSILYKSIAGRYRPVRVADGPITARYRFIKNAYWVHIIRKFHINCPIVHIIRIDTVVRKRNTLTLLCATYAYLEHMLRKCTTERIITHLLRIHMCDICTLTKHSWLIYVLITIMAIVVNVE